MVTAIKVIALSATLAVGACAHHPIVVKCDGKLQPINLPHPKAPETTSGSPPAPPAKHMK
jgi:hypothetical protein